MSNDLIINATTDGYRIALLKDKSLVEYHQEKFDNQFKVGDIYLGTVKKLVSGLNAAFVDIGYEKDAFLHYLDLGPQVKSLTKFGKLIQSRKKNLTVQKFKNEPDINKLGKISQVLTRNQQIVVQVVKEPISSKGPRLSSELSIAGRYLVLVPFSNTVSISRKIASADERKRLTRLINSIKPENFGVIIRTVAENKDVAELDKDLRHLVETWNAGVEKLKTAQPGTKLIGEISRASAMLRDMLNESFDSIATDDKSIYEEVRSYIHQIAPEKEKIVKYQNGKSKIFESFGIEKQLKFLFGQSVGLKSGGYLIIEHTEALHVIDVNSGNKSASEANQESTALHVNLEAAQEISRQLRLRDMGGIIVIDFIDMRKPENKRKVYETMKGLLNNDRTKATVLPLSKFGLMQITRQRVRPETNIITMEKCPTCNGTGKILPSIVVADKIQNDIDFLYSKQNAHRVSLSVHPYLYAFFTKGFPSKQQKWFLKHLKWVKIVVDSSLAITDYKFIGKEGEEIEI